MSSLNLNGVSDDDRFAYDGPELWRTPPGLPLVYQVSTAGRYRTRMDTTNVNGFNRTITRPDFRLVVPATNSGGYRYVTFFDIHGTKQTKALHRLILETFVGPCPAGMTLVRHWNDQRADNRLSNIAWGTPSENHQDRIRNAARKRAQAQANQRAQAQGSQPVESCATGQ